MRDLAAELRGTAARERRQGRNDVPQLCEDAADELAALRARVAEAVRMIEGYKRAGWLTNPAAAEQATDFISRAASNKEASRK